MVTKKGATTWREGEVNPVVEQMVEAGGPKSGQMEELEGSSGEAEAEDRIQAPREQRGEEIQKTSRKVKRHAKGDCR